MNVPLTTKLYFTPKKSNPKFFLDKKFVTLLFCLHENEFVNNEYLNNIWKICETLGYERGKEAEILGIDDGAIFNFESIVKHPMDLHIVFLGADLSGVTNLSQHKLYYFKNHKFWITYTMQEMTSDTNKKLEFWNFLKKNTHV